MTSFVRSLNVFSVLFALTVLFNDSFVKSDSLSDACLRCICEAEGCYSKAGQCESDALGVLRCGPYQISREYWNECDLPEGDFERCGKQVRCSENCVRTYQQKYAAFCTVQIGRTTPTCEDYGRVHRGGPGGCWSSETANYGSIIRGCCAGNC